MTTADDTAGHPAPDAGTGPGTGEPHGADSTLTQNEAPDTGPAGTAPGAGAMDTASGTSEAGTASGADHAGTAARTGATGTASGAGPGGGEGRRGGVLTRGTVTVDRERCKGCELCIPACRPGVLAMSVEVNAIGYRYPELAAGCTGCRACHAVCPDFVFEVYKYDEPILLPREGRA